MNTPDSISTKKYFTIDSCQYVIPDAPPAIHIIHSESFSEYLTYKLKTNLNLPQNIHTDTLTNDTLPQKLLTSTVKKINERQLPAKSFDWFFVSFFLLYFLLAFIKLQSNKIFSLSLKGAILKKYKSALLREGDFFKSRSFIFIFLYTIFGFALIIYAFAATYIPIDYEWIKILFLFIGVFITLVAKIILLSFTSFLFNINTLTKKYIQNIILIDYYIAAIIFPFAFIYFYYPFQFF